jgi:hypothetical protein
MTRIPLYQRKITSAAFNRDNIIKNIEASGDALEEKEHGTIRIAFQNILKPTTQLLLASLNPTSILRRN